MSKFIDDMLKKYVNRGQSSRSKTTPAKTPKEKTKAKTIRAKPAEAKVDAPVKSSRRRSVEGLEWTIVEGIEVLRGQGELSNYVAIPAVRPSGTFEILRLSPRGLIYRRVKTKDLLEQIESLVRKDSERQDSERLYQEDRKRIKLEKERRLENQPGFYILPGEKNEVVRDENFSDDDWVPLGPYWRFERIGPRYEPENETEAETDSDVEDDAVGLMLFLRKNGDRTPVKIIEARNRKSARAGRGHVWWENGVFRGPPVGPRQVKLFDR